MAYNPAANADAALPLAGTTKVRSKRELLTWRTGIGAFVLIVWLIPIKAYTLPIKIGFNLEVYRLLVIILLLAFVLQLSEHKVKLYAGGLGRPVLLLAIGSVLAIGANSGAIGKAQLQTQVLKSTSFFLSFLIIYVLVCSTVRNMDDVRAIVMALVIGAAIVAVSALYESRTHYNVFAHLNNWFPFLKPGRDATDNIRGGQLRVRASSQHPIALGVALTMCVPLGLYMWRRATSKNWFWLIASGVTAMAAVVTVSRSVVLGSAAACVVALILRGKAILRRWPLGLALIALLHVGAPGATSHLIKAFTPQGGLAAQLSGGEGARGSGRLTDIKPGLDLWAKSPLVGRGLGTQGTTGQSLSVATGNAVQLTYSPRIIFDDQYMNTLVTLGIVGLISVLWLVWGGIRRLVRAARRTTGDVSDLFVAFSCSCAVFGATLASFDAFSFIQTTLVFFVILGAGLGGCALLGSEPEAEPAGVRP